MKKPHQAHYALMKMIRNPKTGLYEVKEQGVTYAMSLELTRLLKRFFTNNDRGKIVDWYKQLPKEERQSVIRSGHDEAHEDDFFPDPDFD